MLDLQHRRRIWIDDDSALQIQLIQEGEDREAQEGDRDPLEISDRCDANELGRPHEMRGVFDQEIHVGNERGGNESYDVIVSNQCF